MSGRVDARLAELGITLPAATAPVANYVPFVVAGKMVFVSGQIPMLDGALHGVGRVGEDFGVAEGYGFARICGLNLIAQAKAAAGGDLDKIKRVVRLGGFVACADRFTDQPKVINGASDLMVEVFGEQGRHARAAVGTNALPLGVSVEIEAVFELE